LTGNSGGAENDERVRTSAAAHHCLNQIVNGS